ncbi:6663_t:CDS:10 [Funneliformis geosporum]|uniref:Elongation factor 1 alpha-like protein n=1 Tax=Funneliformis geosporum TaxID=1117311 RepID=A0A9W4SX53_9GLOM|nr:6663_t:CDS:10 [Funneliformis geosporum]
MSRHRAIRSLTAEAVLAESEYYDEDDYDYEDNDELSQEDKAKMDDGKKIVREVIGQVDEISDKDIEDALWHYYYDTKEAITYLLDELHKSKKKKKTNSDSNKSKLTNKDLISNMDHLINGNRYLSPLNFDANQQNLEYHYSLGMRTRTVLTNCVSFDDIWTGHNVKWCSLAQSNLKITENSICEVRKISHHGGLLGGMDSETTQSRLSGLRSQLGSTRTNSQSLSKMASDRATIEQNRSSVGNNDTSNIRQLSLSNIGIGSSGPSLSSLAHLSVKQSTRPSLSSLTTNTISKLGSESVTRPQTSSSLINSQTPSLSSLVKNSTSHSTGRVSLSDLALNRTTNSKQQTSSVSTFLSNKLNNKIPLPTPMVFKNSNPLITDTNRSEMRQKSQHITNEFTQSIIENKEFVQNSYSDIKIQPLSNPLIAPPSIFATSIFAPLQDTISFSNDLITFELYTAGSNNNGFSFVDPSPDDIVKKAQSNRGTGVPKVKDRNISTTSATSVKSTTAKQESSTTQKIEKTPSNTPDEIVLKTLRQRDSGDKQNFSLASSPAFDIGALNLDFEDKSTSHPNKIATTFKPLVSQESLSTRTMSSSTSKSSLKTIPKNKRIDVLAEYKKRSSDKESLNLVIIGHVDAGKSTLMGHLLYLLGEVNEKTMRKYERDSSKIGKSSFAYAWVLDETGEERSRGITMDIAITKFETENRRFTLLDAPGHRDFIPNMISGAAQADVAILVVDATTGEFETGFDSNGQTKEHALLVRSLGVQQLIVAINKLDVVNWSQNRYNDIMAKLNLFLTLAGFKKDKVIYVPCSGLTGENLLKRSENVLEWYSGPTLVQQIDKFEPPIRLLEKPFRLSVSDFFKGGIGSMGGVTVAGRIEAGNIQVGEGVTVIPGGEHGVVKVPVTSHFLAQVVVFEIKVPITRGFPVILYRQSLNEPAIITKLISILDKSTGAVIKKNPRCLVKSSIAIVEIELSNRPIPLETYKENKELGRIMLRKGGETVAAGIVTNSLPVRRLMTDTKLGSLPLRIKVHHLRVKTALKRLPSLMTDITSPLHTSKHHPPFLMTGNGYVGKVTALKRLPSLMTDITSPLHTSKHHPPFLMTGNGYVGKVTALKRLPSLMTDITSPLRTSKHHPPSLMTGVDIWVK